MSKKSDPAAVTTTENRDFYPEDAQERNFEEARRLAVENSEKDQATAQPGVTNEDEGDVKRVIPAQPETTATKNPEQVKVSNSTPAPTDPIKEGKQAAKANSDEEK